MKKIVVICLLLVSVTVAKAQFVETFDSNKFGWQEYVTKTGGAIITEGVMRLENKSALAGILNPGSEVVTSCYPPFDPQKNFIFKCDAKMKRLDFGSYFGIIFDYMDDYNYSVFYITKSLSANAATVVYKRVVENRIVGYRYSDIKLTQKKNLEFNFELKSMFDKLEFYCNNMKAMEIRYNPVKHCGIGFSIAGALVVDFDNVSFVQ
jgi:hypothetical protein